MKKIDYSKVWASFLVALLLLVTSTEGLYAKQSNAETLRMLDLFGDIFEKVRTDYVEEVSDVDLIEASINGMLTSLDPHSSYLSKKGFKEMRIQTRGEFGGLGIEVTMESGLVKVVSPIDDTPAFKAGILAGDYISHIDGDPVMGMTLNEAVEKMRGPVKTEIKITVLREGTKEPIEVSIIRDIIKIRSVRHNMEGDIGYVRITSFSEQTANSVKKSVRKIKEEKGNALKGIILDLRNNPGGLLDQAIAVSDVFLDRGEIVSTRGRTSGSTKRYNADQGDMVNGLPVVVMINGGSASASEIVAGALQDHNRAIVMGTKSFGKGSVQTVIPVPGDGAIRLTTSRYYTPSGKSIQAKGITPDIEVRQGKVEFVGKENNDYTEASLRGHLENRDESGKKSKDKKKNEGDTKDKDSEKESASLYDKDHQLARAVDLLNGVYLFNHSKLN